MERPAKTGAERAASNLLLPSVLALIPLLYAVFAVARYGVDVLYWDEWELVPVLDKFYQGTLSLTDLWAQHYEHRIFLPRIILLAMARLTGWNMSYELALNVLLGVAIFFVLVYQFKASLSSVSVPGLRWIIPIISVMVFSLAQWENWLWGFQMQMFLNVLCVVTGIVLLSNPLFRWWRFFGAMFLGLVATLTFANGVAFWFIGLLILLYYLFAGSGQRKTFRLCVVLWALVGCGTAFFYLYGYHKPAVLPSAWVMINQPAVFLRYEVIYIFSPIATKALAFVLSLPALLACCYFCWLFLRTRAIPVQKIIPYAAITLYVAMSAVVTGVGRAGFGSGQAGQSRYVTISSLLWISIVMVLSVFIAHWDKLPLAGRKKKVLRILAWYSILVVAYLAVLRSAFCLDFAEYRYSYLSSARNELMSTTDVDRLDPDLLLRLYPKPDVIRERLMILQKYHLSVYRGK